MKHFTRAVLILAAALIAPVLIAATDSSPSGSNILGSIFTRVTPTQASFDVPTCGVATAKTWDSTVVGTSPRTIATVYGASLPAGTNKLMVRSNLALTYGDSTVTENAAANLVISANTDTYFRGSKSELDQMYITVATSTAATATIYFFPFRSK